MQFFTSPEKQNKKDLVKLSENFVKLSNTLDVLTTKLLQLEIQMRSLRGFINRKGFAIEDIGEEKNSKDIKTTDGLDSLR